MQMSTFSRVEMGEKKQKTEMRKAATQEGIKIKEIRTKIVALQKKCTEKGIQKCESGFGGVCLSGSGRKAILEHRGDTHTQNISRIKNEHEESGGGGRCSNEKNEPSDTYRETKVTEQAK